MPEGRPTPNARMYSKQAGLEGNHKRMHTGGLANPCTPRMPDTFRGSLLRAAGHLRHEQAERLRHGQRSSYQPAASRNVVVSVEHKMGTPPNLWVYRNSWGGLPSFAESRKVSTWFGTQ